MAFLLFSRSLVLLSGGADPGIGSRCVRPWRQRLPRCGSRGRPTDLGRLPQSAPSLIFPGALPYLPHEGPSTCFVRGNRSEQIQQDKSLPGRPQVVSNRNKRDIRSSGRRWIMSLKVPLTAGEVLGCKFEKSS